MGASIDEHKPFLAYGGSAAGRRPGVNGGGGGGLQAWVRRRWPVLLAASLGGLYLLREVMGPADSAASSDAGSARLSAGARVQGCVFVIFWLCGILDRIGTCSLRRGIGIGM